MSTPEAAGSRDSRNRSRATTSPATPIGTLTRKIQRHDNASTSAPPTSGPVETATAVVAPQMPSAVPRSRPWNSCAISASEVPNIIAPPIPCAARETCRNSGSGANPQASDEAVKIASPSMNTSLRPTLSASDPAASSTPARVSA